MIHSEQQSESSNTVVDQMGDSKTFFVCKLTKCRVNTFKIAEIHITHRQEANG